MSGIDEIRIIDNGHGIICENIRNTFGNLGNSEKALTDKTPNGRAIHGRYGFGRYKALALGSYVQWISNYLDEDQISVFNIKCSINKPNVFNISDKNISGASIGVYVSITGIYEKVSGYFSNSDIVLSDLIKHFAAYLLAYPGIEIVVDGLELKPYKFIEEEIQNDIFIHTENKTNPCKIRLIRWKEGSSGRLYLCSEEGVALYDMAIGVHLGKLPLSVYIQSKYIEDILQQNIVPELDTTFSQIHKEVKNVVRKYYRSWLAVIAAKAMQSLKQENVYREQVLRPAIGAFSVCA